MIGRLLRRPPAIGVDEAARRLEAGEIVLVDVREKPEVKGGRARGARHVPLSALPTRVEALAGEGKPVAFICRSGHRSAAACLAARRKGIEAISVKGGMVAWHRAGLPLTRA